MGNWAVLKTDTEAVAFPAHLVQRVSFDRHEDGSSYVRVFWHDAIHNELSDEVYESDGDLTEAFDAFVAQLNEADSFLSSR